MINLTESHLLLNYKEREGAVKGVRGHHGTTQCQNKFRFTFSFSIIPILYIYSIYILNIKGGSRETQTVSFDVK